MRYNGAMKRGRQNLDYVANRRGRRLDATGAGPYIKLGSAVLTLAAVIALLLFVVIPLAAEGFTDFSRREKRPAGEESENPAATVLPALMTNRIQTYTLNPKKGEAVMADAAILDDRLVYATGEAETALTRIVSVYLNTGRRQVIEPELENDCLRMPRLNDEYIVWFDAKAGGGGNICVRNAATGGDAVLVRLNEGLPVLQLSGRYLVFTANTGLAVKLYAADLSDFSVVTLALFSGEAYAASRPDLADGRVYYAAEQGLRICDLATGEQFSVETGGYAHDPRAAGDGVLWLTADHGEDTDLRYRAADGSVFRIAGGVIDAGAANNCIAYNRDGTVYAYSFITGSTWMLSGAEEYAQLVAAGGDYVLWRVLKSGEAAAYRYLRVN